MTSPSPPCLSLIRRYNRRLRHSRRPRPASLPLSLARGPSSATNLLLPLQYRTRTTASCSREGVRTWSRPSPPTRSRTIRAAARLASPAPDRRPASRSRHSRQSVRSPPTHAWRGFLGSHTGKAGLARWYGALRRGRRGPQHLRRQAVLLGSSQAGTKDRRKCTSMRAGDDGFRTSDGWAAEPSRIIFPSGWTQSSVFRITNFVSIAMGDRRIKVFNLRGD